MGIITAVRLGALCGFVLGMTVAGLIWTRTTKPDPKEEKDEQ